MTRTLRLALPLFLALACIPGLAQYCSSTATTTTCANLEEYIGNVTIGTLNNNSACMNAPAYEDYTALAAPTIIQASGTQISVTVGNWYSTFDTVTVFFDWNGNFVLNDPGEVYALLQGVGNSGGNTLYTGTITPPVGAVSTTRMRVKTVYGASSNPCGTSTWSNTEDYTINTLPPTGLVAVGSASPNPASVGAPVLFTVAVSATSPPNPPTGVSVSMDLSSIGGSPTQVLHDDGLNGDVAAGDLTFSWTQASATNGNFTLSYLAVDSAARTATGTISFGATPVNDACLGSTTVFLGSNGPFNNVNASDSGVVASCGTGYKDVWFNFTAPCTGPYHIDTCSAAPFDTVLSLYSSCGSGELACNNNGAPCGVGSNIASVALNANQIILIRVASNSTTATGAFSLNVNQVFTLTYGSNGSGTIAFLLSGGPLNGTYYNAISFIPGGYPAGWFYGVDILFPDLVSQINFGYPFVGPLDGCGGSFFGPIGGIPPNLTIWSVGVASPGPFLTLPTAVTPAVTYTVP